MIKPDVCLVWPKHVDYPLFRMRLNELRPYFENVYICLSEHYRPLDLEQFLKEKLVDCTFVGMTYATHDWRNRAVNSILQKSQSPYILFLEQDFLMRNMQVIHTVLAVEEDQPAVIGYKEGMRIHPAFALIPREIVFTTTRDFSAHPDDGLDHFGRFFEELRGKAKFIDIREFEFKEGKDFYHMAGLTQNYNCQFDGQPFYKTNEFLTYNAESLNIPTDHGFQLLEKNIKDIHGSGNDAMIKSFFNNL